MAIGATVVALTSQRLQSGNNVEFDMAPLHSGEDKARWRRGPDMLTAAPRGRLAHPCHIPETATDMLRFKAA